MENFCVSKNIPFSYHSSRGGLAEAILAELDNLSKPVCRFLSTIFSQWWSVLGRYNFTNLARYLPYNEQSLRHGYTRKFDFFTFNRHIIKSRCSDELVLAFDPTFISKSGRHTFGLGHYWSGLEKRMKRGLEIGCLAAIDVVNQTGFHLDALQTLPTAQRRKKGISLMGYYRDFILARVDKLVLLSRYLTVDGYFMRKHFIPPLVAKGLHVITKMRPDAYLQYLFNGEQKKKGRARKYAGKVQWDKLDRRKWKKIYSTKQEEHYWAILYCKALKMNVAVIYRLYKEKQERNYEILLCTDLELEPAKIVKYYSMRFQVEFLIRDAKQFSGLEDCQARDRRKMGFHFNLSLTNINLAKAEYYLSIPKDKRGCFSLQNIKRQHYNQLLTGFIFDTLGLDLKCKKTRELYDLCTEFGKMAA